MNLHEAAAGLRARKFSSRELVDESLRRIARANPKINAFITITEEHARARAALADDELARGIDRGPLHGLPIAHKDLMMTRGIRTSAGSKIFSNFVSDVDADVVRKLDEAGAVMVGKTNLHELAYGITSNNPHFGPVRNPWDIERIPGGSSGGSGAALAADLVFMATGTDTGGSIRIPSSFCGTVGLKPTYDRVSKRGVMPLGITLDHVGPMTRTVRDCAISFNAMLDANPVEVPPKNVDIRGLRIGLPENFYFDRLDLNVAQAVRNVVQTAAALGAKIVDVRVPDIEAINTVGRILLLVEAVANLRPHLDRRHEFGSDVLALLDQGRLLSAVDYVDAQRLRRILLGEFLRNFLVADCILTAATPTAAPKIGQTTMKVGDFEDDVRLATTRMMRGINVLGIPALAMPCGFSEARLPLGMQLLGPAHSEQMLLKIGAALEDALALNCQCPVVFS